MKKGIGVPKYENNENKLNELVVSNHSFAIKFYSKLFLSIFLNKLPNETKLKLIEDLFKQNLFNVDLLKKYFHFIFKGFFINSTSDYFNLNESEDNSIDLEQSILKAIENILTIYIDNSPDKQAKNQDRMKIFINLLQINLNDDLAFTSSNQSLTSLYKIIFSCNEKIFSQNNLFNILHYFNSYKILLKCFMLSNKTKPINIVSSIINKNNYQIFLHHFILFKLSDCIKICCNNLLEFKTSNLNQTEFYEINIFNINFLDSIKDVLKSFINHLDINKMEIDYFDWPISCIIWNFFDYLNISESLNLKLDFINEFNMNLFYYLIGLIEVNLQFSERFKRLANFLNLIQTSESSQFLNDETKDKFAFVLMLNLRNLTQRIQIPTSQPVHFEKELKNCLNSIDFDRLESSKYILCYLSNLLAIEFKNKLGKNSLLNNESVESIRSILKLFINKLVNLCSLNHLNNHLKELACFCLSVIGPIDFKSYHLPSDKNDKYEIKHSNEYCTKQRRVFILHKLSSSSFNTMVYFYYLVIECLIENLISDKYELFYRYF